MSTETYILNEVLMITMIVRGYLRTNKPSITYLVQKALPLEFSDH